VSDVPPPPPPPPPPPSYGGPPAGPQVGPALSYGFNKYFANFGPFLAVIFIPVLAQLLLSFIGQFVIRGVFGYAFAQVLGVLISMILYYKNRASVFCNPTGLTLDETADPCDQMYTVDILRDGADPFSIDPADIVKTVFRTSPSSPSGMSPTKFSVTLSGVGNVILRFGEVDNQNYFNASVDNVTVNNG